MDILVMLDEAPDHSPVLAHVNSVPPARPETAGRDVVTFTVFRVPTRLRSAVRQRGSLIARVRKWATRFATSDCGGPRRPWDCRLARCQDCDSLSPRPEIPLDKRRATAGLLLAEFGSLIRRLSAGLAMPDWPEGARRAITVSLGPIVGLTVPVFAPLESMLDRLREADGLAFEYEGD